MSASQKKNITKAVQNMKSGENKGNHPFDARFPNTNQTRNCWQNYVDFYRCKKVKGKDYKPCTYFKKVYKAICPGDWVAKWDDQRDTGTFPAKF